MKYKNDIKNCLSVLQSGGIILYPTDTIWGIGCDATNNNAVAKIYNLKNRADEKSMIILLSNPNDLKHYLKSVNTKIFDYLKNATKPTTVIYPNAINLAKNLINKNGSIAIRIVQDDFCKQLIEAFKKPIVSTSANVSKCPPPLSFSHIEAVIKNGVDYIVQHRQNDITEALPSTIVKLNTDGCFTFIRL